MRYYLDRFLHFLTSHSTHGTHSPFVYDLADRAIYTDKAVQDIVGSENINVKYKKILLRILNHLGIHSVMKIQTFSIRVECGVVGRIKSPFSLNPDCRCERESMVDAVLLTAGTLSVDEVVQYLQKGNVLVVDGIYVDRQSKVNWKAAHELQDVTVSIDLFYFGLLINRAGQVKEDFKLRYPFWIW